MRVDKFLNVINITKRHSIAGNMCKSKVVDTNDTIIKPSKDVKIGDIITLYLNERKESHKVLALPTSRNTPKNAQSEYVSKL